MALTDLKCKKATCAKDKATKYYFHDNGISLRVSRTGAKIWVAQISYNKKRTNITLGAYPTLSIRDVEKLVAKYKDMASRGIDPVQAHRNSKDESLFSSDFINLSFINCSI